MQDKRKLLNHFLGALAYRTQKALRNAPEDFGSFRVNDCVRTPAELVRQLASVLGYATTWDARRGVCAMAFAIRFWKMRRSRLASAYTTKSSWTSFVRRVVPSARRASRGREQRARSSSFMIRQDNSCPIRNYCNMAYLCRQALHDL